VRRLVALLLVLLSSCATVRPWDRAGHADRRMSPSPCPGSDGLAQHVIDVREGGLAGATASGSGCGCD
jgi:hypothetical protein